MHDAYLPVNIQADCTVISSCSTFLEVYNVLKGRRMLALFGLIQFGFACEQRLQGRSLHPQVKAGSLQASWCKLCRLMTGCCCQGMMQNYSESNLGSACKCRSLPNLADPYMVYLVVVIQQKSSGVLTIASICHTLLSYELQTNCHNKSM